MEMDKWGNPPGQNIADMENLKMTGACIMFYMVCSENIKMEGGKMRSTC